MAIKATRWRVRAWGYGQALRALTEVVCKSGLNLRLLENKKCFDACGWTWCVGKENRSILDVHLGYNADDAGHVSRKLVTGEGLQRQPGQDTLWAQL